MILDCIKGLSKIFPLASVRAFLWHPLRRTGVDPRRDAMQREMTRGTGARPRLRTDRASLTVRPCELVDTLVGTEGLEATHHRRAKRAVWVPLNEVATRAASTTAIDRELAKLPSHIPIFTRTKASCRQDVQGTPDTHRTGLPPERERILGNRRAE